jgi:BirA family biotin operon repressor/biotin-[acetyl-CoA-carboxylase] ligase
VSDEAPRARAIPAFSVAASGGVGGSGALIIGCVVHAFESVTSTQELVAALAREGAPAGTTVTAAHQTGGRGRRGRSWWDAPGESLLLSILLRPPGPVAQAPQLSLVAALAVADALGTAAALRARIRWPNDVLVDGRKISGILPEAVSGDGRVVGHVVLGLGINVNQTKFPAALAARSTSIRQLTGRPHELVPLRRDVLEALERRYARWLAGGFAALRDECRQRSCTLGERVRGDGGVQGLAVDITEDGALLVDTGGGALMRVVSVPADAAEPGEVEHDAARH